MRKIVYYFIMFSASAFLIGCGNQNNNTMENSVVDIEEVYEKDTQNSAELTQEDLTNTGEEISVSETEKINESEPTEISEEIKYDRTYLQEVDGVMTYVLSDTEMIDEYDKLYADAFADTLDSLNSIIGWMNQGYIEDDSITVGYIIMDNGQGGIATRTGSYYELDYNFDVNNVGYTYVDLNCDGTYELILGVLSDAKLSWIPKDYFERAYAIKDGKVVRFYSGGSRYIHWLGSDGYIYEDISGGFAVGGTYRQHFDSSQLVAGEDIDLGNVGIVNEEYLGWYNVPVHIIEPEGDLFDEAEMPVNQITEEELESMEKEWSSRRVTIEWLRLSDYLDKYYQKEDFSRR